MEDKKDNESVFNWEDLTPMERIHAMRSEEKTVVLGMLFVPELSADEKSRRDRLFESVFGNSKELDELATNLRTIEKFSSLLYKDLDFEKARALEKEYIEALCKTYLSGVRIFYLVSSSCFNLPTPELYENCCTRIQFCGWGLDQLWTGIPFEKRSSAYDQMYKDLVSKNLGSDEHKLQLEGHHDFAYVLDQLAYEAGKQLRQNDYRLEPAINILKKRILNILPSLITPELESKRTVAPDSGATGPLDSQYFSLLESLPREITKRRQLAAKAPRPKSSMRPFWQTFRMGEDGTITNVVYGQSRYVYKTDHPDYEKILNKLVEEYPDLKSGKVCGYTRNDSGEKEYY